MEKGLFHDLYKRLIALDIRSCPLDSLSGLLHGYLTVYSMVRVYPWLEREFGNPGDIHERAKEIARLYSGQLRNEDVSVDSRVGYAADIMDVYQLYSDLGYLNHGLDAAYRLWAAGGNGRISLPCRTPNVCRLLCNCYYFAGDETCGELAGRLVTEALGYTRKGDCGNLLAWWDAICLYDDVVGAMMLFGEEQERLREERGRLTVTVKQQENEKIEYFRTVGDDADICLQAEIFAILARREFAECNKRFGIKG